jgi:hypothetical protein
MSHCYATDKRATIEELLETVFCVKVRDTVALRLWDNDPNLYSELPSAVMNPVPPGKYKSLKLYGGEAYDCSAD